MSVYDVPDPPQISHSLEHKLLLACARIPTQQCAIKEMLNPGLDWPYFIATAKRHGVLPLVFQNLTSVSQSSIPEEHLNTLNKYFYLNSSRNLYLTEKLIELLHQLRSQNVNAVPYKGPVLSSQVYGSLGFREFADLDILLPPEEVLQARYILERFGYRSTANLTPKQEKAFLASNHAYSMYQKDDKTVVELHWRFTPRYFAHTLERNGIWTRLTNISLNGSPVPALSKEDLIQVLSAHGTKHCWNRLSYICDVAQIIHNDPEINWDQITQTAKNSGGLRMLNIALLSAHKLLKVEIPNRIKLEIEKDKLVNSMTEQIVNSLFDKKTATGELSRIPFHLKARERLKDKVSYLFLFFMTPTPEDFKTFRLPAQLFPLYRITRPLRLFWLSLRSKHFPRFESV